MVRDDGIQGLSDYLLGDDDLPNLLVKTQIDKLTLLTGGSTQDNPVELIASKGWRLLLMN